MEILRDGARYVSPFTVHSADVLDTAFEERFRSPLWSTERVLRFVSSTDSSLVTDDVVVRNISGRPIRHLVLKSEDLILMLDVAPDQTVHVPVTAQRVISAVWIAAWGSFTDGTVLKYRGVDFGPSDPEPSIGQKYTLIVTIDSDTPILSMRHPDGTAARVLSRATRP
jgi:hypothetical protein